MEDIPVK